MNVPGEGRKVGNIAANFIGTWPGRLGPTGLNTGWGPNYPPGQAPSQAVLSNNPVCFLIRVIDASHMQMGARSNATQPWLLTSVFEAPFVVSSFGEHAFSGFAGAGAPVHQQIMIDYWRYRAGLSSGDYSASNSLLFE